MPRERSTPPGEILRRERDGEKVDLTVYDDYHLVNRVIELTLLEEALMAGLDLRPEPSSSKFTERQPSEDQDDS